MAALCKFCIFTHIRSLIMFLSTTFFTFIFPFEAQKCCAWTVLRTNTMSCLTLLRLLDVYMWIFVSCCLWWLTHVVSKVEKLHTKYLLIKRMGLLLLSCSFLALFVSICVVMFFVVVFLFFTCCLGFQFFCFCKHFFATIHSYRVHFPCYWVCIFLFACCCLLVLYLIISFIVAWVSNFFVSLNIF